MRNLLKLIIRYMSASDAERQELSDAYDMLVQGAAMARNGLKELE